MTVSQSRSNFPSEKLLLWAAALSLALHLVAFGTWKWGQTHGWWQHLALPRWMEVARKKLELVAIKVPPPQPPLQPAPLLFINVDPDLAVPVPPANPKFYSSADTVAANVEKKKPSDMPNLTGKQDKVLQTVPTGEKNFPLKPATPTPPAPERTEAVEARTAPKPTSAAGDLTTAKPADKPQDKPGTTDSNEGDASQPQEKHDRPRTLADARDRKGIHGQQSQEEGGVTHLAKDPSMDAMKTVAGEYDAEFIAAVQNAWEALLEDRPPNVSGKVILEFTLHADGRITDMKMPVNEVSELYGVICQSAIFRPAPYKPWPQKMRREIPDPRPLRFTFYYGYE